MGSAGADTRTVTREVPRDCLHGVVSTWGWYSLGRSAHQLRETIDCAYSDPPVWEHVGTGIHDCCYC